MVTISMKVILFVLISLIGYITAQCLTGGTKLTAATPNAVIPAGQTYYIDSDLALTTLNVSGTLYFKNTPSNLSLNWLRVNNGGKLFIGQQTCQITAKITITLNGARNDTSCDIGVDPADNVCMGSKGIAIATGGSLEIWGAYTKKHYVNLKALANINDSYIYVDAGTSWVAGDTIVVVETDFPAVPFTYTENFDQNEVRTITNITANVACPGSSTLKCDKIGLNTALKYVHYYNANEYGGEVAHLTRNIVLRGDSSSAQSLFGGHLMIRPTPAAKIVGAEFTFFGQRGVVGRYPIHFHLLGQTDGINVFARYNSIHDNFQRALVIHDSNNITVEYNVAYNITTSAYFLEDGGEINNVFNYNLGAKVLNIKQGDKQIIPSDTQASVFWIPNPLNDFVGNVAAGGTFGFWYVMPPKPNGKSQAKYANNPNMSPRDMPMGKFTNNVVHSNRESGVMVDEFQNMDGTIQGVANPPWRPRQGPYNTTTSGPAIEGSFSDILAYKNRNFGLWFRAASLKFDRIKMYDNRIGFQAVVMPATIQNSVFICETANTGYVVDPKWKDFVITPRSRAYLWSEKAPLYGYQNYDASGPQFQNNNTFGGCFSNKFRNSSIISSLENAHNILFPQNRYLRTNILDGSQRFFYQRFPNNFSTNPFEQDSPKYTYVHDVDGTITGNMGTWMVPQEAFHTYGLTGCAYNATENCQRCAPFYEGFGYLNIKNMDIANTDFAGTNLNATSPWLRSSWYYFGDTTKSKGISTAGENPSDATRTEYRTNFIARRGIMVNWPHPSPPSIDLMYTAAAGGDWVVVGIPYPAGTFTVARNTWPQKTFTQVTSLNDLVADTYYFANNVLYVRLQNPQNNVANNFTGGFVYQSSWNNQVSIKHSCSKSSCNAGSPSVPAALPAYESLFKADLCPGVNVTSNTYGVAFLGFDIRTKALSYQIYHGKGPQSNKLTLGGIDLGLPFSPAEGILYPSYTQYANLFSGKWNAQINELVGKVGCDTSRNTNCVAPPNISLQAACSIAQNDMVLITSNAINKITNNKLASWSSWSWNTDISTSTDKPTTCTGAGSLKITTRNGGFSLHNDNNGISIPTNHFFQFFVKAVVPNRVELSIAINSGTALRVVSKHINHWAITDETFTRVKIPLSDFGFTATGNVTIERIDIMYFESWNLKNNQTTLFTDVRFVAPTVADTLGVPQTLTQSNYVAKNCKVDPTLLLKGYFANVRALAPSFSDKKTTSSPSDGDIALYVIIGVAALLALVALVVAIVVVSRRNQSTNNATLKEPLLN